jgi:rhodanese-related sulfurtransferase
MITTDKPRLQDFHLEGVRHIAPSDAFEALKNGYAIMIDVREETEFLTESIPLPDVFYYPMSGIKEKLRYIPNDKPVIVVCKAGIRSTKVSDLLNRNGFLYSVNLDGGIITWKAQGLPIDSGQAPDYGCGCSCSKK